VREDVFARRMEVSLKVGIVGSGLVGARVCWSAPGMLITRVDKKPTHSAKGRRDAIANREVLRLRQESCACIEVEAAYSSNDELVRRAARFALSRSPDYRFGPLLSRPCLTVIPAAPCAVLNIL
jgi:hypothetical protein